MHWNVANQNKVFQRDVQWSKIKRMIVFRCLPVCPSLVSLDLSANPAVTSAGLRSLLDALVEAQRPLTHLNLQGTVIHLFSYFPISPLMSHQLRSINTCLLCILVLYRVSGLAVPYVRWVVSNSWSLKSVNNVFFCRHDHKFLFFLSRQVVRCLAPGVI